MRIGAWARLKGGYFSRSLADAYTTILRGIPDLLVIYLFYFGSSAVLTPPGAFLGASGFISIPGFLAGSLAIGLVSGAYQTEVMRGAYRAVSPGEIEAAIASGMLHKGLVEDEGSPGELFTASRSDRFRQFLAGSNCYCS